MKQFERDYEQCKKVMDRRLNQKVLETGAKYDEQVEQKAPVLLSVGSSLHGDAPSANSGDF